MEHHVIIMGAGASGMLAAQELSRTHRVTIIESRSVCGGRIRSVRLPDQEGIIEAGAEFIHGEVPITERLIREAKLTKLPLEGKMYRIEEGRWKKQDEMIEGWDDLLHKMKNEPSSSTMDQFLNRHFSSPRFAALRKHVQGYVHGFDVANMSEVSVSSLYEEWANEGEQFHLKEGYSAIISYLEDSLRSRGVDFLMSDPVRSIKWKRHRVEVLTASGHTITGSRLLTTVPIPVLRNPALLPFMPAIHDQREAAAAIGFGSVVKIVLNFKEMFWTKDLGFLLSDEKIPTWWTRYPQENFLLTGWAGGPDAMRIYHLSNDELLDLALESLFHIFEKSIHELGTILRSSYVFNWISEMDCHGAYSYARPGSDEARRILQQPVENTLFFAGEGLYEGPYPGTVEAAFTSGIRAAQQIVHSFS